MKVENLTELIGPRGKVKAEEAACASGVLIISDLVLLQYWLQKASLLKLTLATEG